MDRKRIAEFINGTADSVPTYPPGSYADHRDDFGSDLVWYQGGQKSKQLPCPPDYVRGENPPADCYSCTEYKQCPESTANRGGDLVCVATIFGTFAVLALLYYIGDAFWKSVLR